MVAIVCGEPSEQGNHARDVTTMACWRSVKLGNDERIATQRNATQCHAMCNSECRAFIESARADPACILAFAG